MSHNPAMPAFSDQNASGFLPSRSNGLAFAEGILLLGGLAMLDYVGLLPFTTWPVHPFLFVVVLLSAQYGLQGGVIAALGAIALSHLDGWPARPIDMSYAEYFRMAWADSLSWVLAALTVGVVTSHRGRVLQETTAKLRKAMMAEELIAAQYQVLAQRTHKLERSLAGRVDTTSDEKRVQAPAKPAKGSKSSRANGAGHSRRWNADGHL